MSIENDNGEIRTFIIPVTWEECGQFIVRARTLKEAIDAVEGNEDGCFGTSSANGEYVDDSFKVNRDCLTVVSDISLYDDLFVDLTIEEDDESSS